MYLVARQGNQLFEEMDPHAPHLLVLLSKPTGSSIPSSSPTAWQPCDRFSIVGFQEMINRGEAEGSGSEVSTSRPVCLNNFPLFRAKRGDICWNM